MGGGSLESFWGVRESWMWGDASRHQRYFKCMVRIVGFNQLKMRKGKEQEGYPGVGSSKYIPLRHCAVSKECRY